VARASTGEARRGGRRRDVVLRRGSQGGAELHGGAARRGTPAREGVARSRDEDARARFQ
jgi:hypothetical protein